ncbi:hypothetical protein [Mucilaginibacter jinjuensis]|uniref:Type II secretion system protein GspC N-terminal domain-containing protein n=1 Tax=Mucilaginibacter jinjuensis TaxID=1176721 RepID=A0ABY7TD88_9SPHI|nr:hypothetical protein [Mucilaginibacter jinjuensis]WCT13658.1 hypothetical protein PQO05_06880 [Mucilaginibacter jinjuensis]
MKNKMLNYFLILAVAAIWGLIIYRIVNAYSNQDDPPINGPSVQVIDKLPEDYGNLKDTTTLILKYRNPFISEPKKVDQEVPVSDLIGKMPVVRNTPVKPAPAAINWNFIQYSGYIRNSKTKKLLAIVSINGHQYMMDEGETDGQVKLLKNLKDSVKIIFEGRTKFITMAVK